MSRPTTASRLQYITTTAAAALFCTFATGASAQQFLDAPLAGVLQGQYGADAVKAVTASAADATKAIAAQQKLVDAATTAANAVLTTAAKTTAANTYVAKSTADAAALALVDTTSTALDEANSAVAAANLVSAPLATAVTSAATALTNAKTATAAALATYSAPGGSNPANLTAYNAAVAAQTLAQTASDTAVATAAPKLAATAAATATAVTASGAAASAVTAQGITNAALQTAAAGLGTAGIGGYAALLTTQASAQQGLANVTDDAADTLAYAARVNSGATILTGIAATANTALNAKAAARALLGTSIAGDSTSEVEVVRGLNNEELQRVAADVVLGGRITTETTRATTAETALGGRIDTTNTRITILTAQVKKDIAAATAVSVALGGNSFLPGKKFNLTVNVGSYDGESALAAQFGFMVNDSLAINGGVASGFGSGSSTAVRGGFTYGW